MRPARCLRPPRLVRAAPAERRHAVHAVPATVAGHLPPAPCGAALVAHGDAHVVAAPSGGERLAAVRRHVPARPAAQRGVRRRQARRGRRRVPARRRRGGRVSWRWNFVRDLRHGPEDGSQVGLAPAKAANPRRRGRQRHRTAPRGRRGGGQRVRRGELQRGGRLPQPEQHRPSSPRALRPAACARLCAAVRAAVAAPPYCQGRHGLAGAPARTTPHHGREAPGGGAHDGAAAEDAPLRRPRVNAPSRCARGEQTCAAAGPPRPFVGGRAPPRAGAPRHVRCGPRSRHASRAGGAQ
mmetsp:Transcript_47236/g.145709  ORF Transcript_47236/g.145709 Transcript_47236/m.145709 type:complete len:296 (+) Transcript_47236:402-1289(+)